METVEDGGSEVGGKVVALDESYHLPPLVSKMAISGPLIYDAISKRVDRSTQNLEGRRGRRYPVDPPNFMKIAWLVSKRRSFEYSIRVFEYLCGKGRR